MHWQVFALGSALFAALTAILGKIGVAGVNSDLATFLRTIVILIVTGLIVTFRAEWQPITSVSSRTLIFLALSAVATGLSWLCYYRALQIGPASRVAPVDKLSVVLVILLAAIFLHERPNPKELFGGLLITVGAIVIAVA